MKTAAVMSKISTEPRLLKVFTLTQMPVAQRGDEQTRGHDRQLGGHDDREILPPAIIGEFAVQERTRATHRAAL